jgi:hypothetical protein
MSQRTGTRWTTKRRTWVSSRAIGALALSAVFLGCAAGCAERTVTPTVTPAHSGMTVGLTQAVHLRYRVIISSVDVGTSTSRRFGRQTGTAQIWARGAQGRHPGAVREGLVVLPRDQGGAAGQCISLQYAVAGGWGYAVPYWDPCAPSPMIAFSAYAFPVTSPDLPPFPDTILSQTFFSDSEASRFRSGGATFRHSTLGGHRVWAVGPDFRPVGNRLRMSLSFDRQSHILREMDATLNIPYSSVPAGSAQAVTYHYRFVLVHSKTLPAKAVPTWFLRLPIQEAHLPIGIPVTVSRARLSALCPGIRHMNRLLDRGLGPLRTCRTVAPSMSASRLAAQFMTAEPYKALRQAAAAGVFSRRLVERSLAAEHGSLAKWVIWSHSLKYLPTGSRLW